MKGLDHKTCAVRGEPVYHPGSENDFARGKLVGEGLETVDGVNTMEGIICRDCMPVLDLANRKTLLFKGGYKRKEMSRLMNNPAFVSAAIQDGARRKIETILGDFSEEDDWKNSVRSLRAFLMQNFTINSFPGDDLGLPPERALGCMNEEKRTMKFVQGLYGALADLDVRREEIEMVDAGTGPVPIFGILAALKSPKTKVTCLEINQGSAKMAAKIIERLCLQDRVKVVCTDATNYKHDKPIDLLISETMYVGLTEEPQAQIFNNLAPQVVPDGVVIPEEIIVKVGLAKESKIHPLILRQMLKPDRQTELMLYALGPVDVASLSRASILDTIDFSLPVDSLVEGQYRMVFSSNVGVFGGIRVDEADSVITAPHLHDAVLGINNQMRKIVVSYVPGTRMEDIKIVEEK